MLVTAVSMGCSQPKSATDPNLSDLNLYITSKVQIDSVFISDIGQQREFYFIPFNDTLNIKLNDSINDLYNIDLYTVNGRSSNQLWLDGEQVIIKANFDEKLNIDTVIGSKLHYESLRLKNEISGLYRERNRPKLIDQFFMQKFEEYLYSPLSLMVLSNYHYRLQNDRQKIETVVAQLETQSSFLRNHPISRYNALVKILNTGAINLEAFDFIGLNQEKTKLKKVEKGQLYLLDFWFVNCIPCVQDHKIIAKDTEFLRTNKIQLRGISIDQDHQKWRSYLTEHAYAWPNYRETDTGKITQKMDITAYPTYYLLDETGVILSRSNSYNDIKKFLANN